MLRCSYGVAGAAATSLPAGRSQTRANGPEPGRKLRVGAVGGHFDDPQTCAGGTLTLFADQGHDVVALSITGGPPPTPDRNPEEREVKNRLNAMRMAEILKIRLVCMKYQGSSSGAYAPLVYRSGSEVTGERYKEFTEVLLDGYKPDIVITHWPIDFNVDHWAASLLTYSAWVSSGKRFPLYYMEAELGQQTQNFFPTHYVDITPVAERKHQAWLADTLWYDLIYPLHDLMAQMRGMEHGCKLAEAFNHHPRSPAAPVLP